ncbi:MAG TPA: family 20 glycosylhydrolase [Erysipelothrix sp.]
MILPIPKILKKGNKKFVIDQNVKILIQPDLSSQVYESAVFFQNRVNEEQGLYIDIIKAKMSRFKTIQLAHDASLNKQAYTLEVTQEGILISGHDAQAIHYGLMTLLQLIKAEGLILKTVSIQDEPRFLHRGFYHDVTRGKVPTKQTLFQLIDDLSEYKINELQLYIEHTFLWEHLTEATRDKDALSAQDIIEIDNYAHKRHIELIPSIATFGHMYEILRTRSYSHLSEKEIDFNEPFSFVNRMAHHTINVSEDESLALIRTMIEDFIPLFRSNKFNICGDETFDLGKYRNKALGEAKGIGNLYVDFLTEIIKIVQENDREVLFWGDIILKYPESISRLPEDVVCLNWGYNAHETEDNTKIIAQSHIPQYVCPSTTGWNRMINWLDNSSENIRKMVKYADKYDAYGILNTDWGDHGHVNLLGSSMPMVVYAAALSWNPSGLETDELADPIISQSYYGDAHILPLLRKMSRQQPANWSYINFHLEREYANYEVISPYFEIMKNLDHQEIYQASQTIDHLKEEMLALAGNFKVQHRQDFNEFIVMSDLMKLTQESFLYFMKYDMDVSDVKLTRSANEIAMDIEVAMEQYKKVWRKRNRESELNRVTEKFYEIADKLRKY